MLSNEAGKIDRYTGAAQSRFPLYVKKTLSFHFETSYDFEMKFDKKYDSVIVRIEIDRVGL